MGHQEILSESDWYKLPDHVMRRETQSGDEVHLAKIPGWKQLDRKRLPTTKRKKHLAFAFLFHLQTVCFHCICIFIFIRFILF